MGTITLSVPDKLKQDMSKTDWINWSSVARRAFAATLEDVEQLKRLREARAVVESVASKSRLSEEEAGRFAVELGREMKKGRFEKLKKLGLVE